MHNLNAQDIEKIKDITSFDAVSELEKIRERRKLNRKKHYQKSRLDKYRAELVKLRQNGASFPELALWLRLERHTKMSHTTIMRYLSKLPELAKNKETANAEIS
ncbi:MAG: hypothetical protein PVG30_09130 [Gammaproteobacteria bacterium]|jgi:hypothetical protein